MAPRKGEMTMTNINTIQEGQILKGFINCGANNPFYNESVLLKVTCVLSGPHFGNQTRIKVETVEKRDMLQGTVDLTTGKLVEKWIEPQTYSNWLDMSKPFEII